MLRRYGVGWGGMVWWCGVVWFGVARRGVARHSMAWRSMVWCVVLWCALLWYGVVWCGCVVRVWSVVWARRVWLCLGYVTVCGMCACVARGEVRTDSVWRVACGVWCGKW